MTAAELARRASVSRSLVSKVEQGQRQATEDYLRAVAPWLGRTADDLFELAGLHVVRGESNPDHDLPAELLRVVQSALVVDLWSREVADAILTIAHASMAKLADDGHCQAAFDAAVAQFLQQTVGAGASRKTWTAEQISQAMTGLLGSLFREELARRRTMTAP